MLFHIAFTVSIVQAASYLSALHVFSSSFASYLTPTRDRGDLEASTLRGALVDETTACRKYETERIC